MPGAGPVVPSILFSFIYTFKPGHHTHARNLQLHICRISTLQLETKAIRRFANVSIVSYSRPSLMIIASVSQFHVYLPLGQRLFSIVS